MLSLTDFFIGFEQPAYNVPESVGVTSVCVVVTEAPAGGFENMPIVSLMSRNRDNAGLCVFATRMDVSDCFIA